MLYYILGSYIISGFMGYCGIYLAIYDLVEAIATLQQASSSALGAICHVAAGLLLPRAATAYPNEIQSTRSEYVWHLLSCRLR